MDSVATWLEDDEGRVENIERRRRRDHSNIMELSHERNFRLSKEAFLYTLEAIENQLPIPRRQTAVPGMISDHNMKILAVDGKYGGASHDSHVWGVSAEKAYLQRSFLNGDRSSWLLGDSGYPLEPWLLTPYRVAAENSPECKFNERLSAARSLIEGTFGVLKGRFRCLLAARELFYSPKKATQILNSCCLEFKVELPTVEPITIDDSFHFGESHSITGNDLQGFATRTRHEIKDSLV